MDTSFDPTLESDIKELMKEVPAPVRAFFASGKVETVAKNLMQKYRLHIDQGAVVEREVILLLLGLKGPEEFAKTLAEEAKLDQQTVNGITQDVNAQIFVPLRDEMRKVGGSQASTSQKPAAAQTPPRVVVRPPAPAEIKPPQAQTSPAAPKYAPIPKFPHLLQNKLPDKKLLEDHEEPHIEFHKTAPPPANLPGAIHHPPLNNPRPPEVRPSPVIPKVEPQIPKSPPPPAKPYSSDPYREPIDEK